MKIILFLIGGRLYTWIEILWRGYTHWSMFVLGGLCFVIMGLLNEYKFKWNESLAVQSVVSACIITLFEFITGCVVNLYMGLNVWDYSNLPFNLLGQICLYYFLLWIPLSIVGIIADDWIRYWFYFIVRKYCDVEEREKPHYCFK